MVNKTINSLLIGNGLDIQAGGDDYQNKWIIVRLLAKAKTGKYDELFMNSKNAIPILTGDDIITFISAMVEIANKARENKYDDLVKNSNIKDVKDIIVALNDFRARYTYNITSVEEIGMEDWILMLQLFLIEQDDILDQYEAAKQGFERMVFDSIYCEGNIQRLHSKMGKSAKTYFSNFDNIFTLNYDNTIEKLINHTVYHLHGDFRTKSISFANNAYGYWRKKNGLSVWFPTQFEHCNCNAILDFSGNRKYKCATAFTRLFTECEKKRKAISDGNYDNILEKLPDKWQEIIQIAIEKKLPCGYNYHFQDFEQLTGTLTIIGLSPKNDSHIFSCINKSNIEKVVFYYYFDEESKDKVNEKIKTVKLPLNKPYTIKNIKEVWNEIKLSKPNNSNTYTKILLHKNSEVKNSDVLNVFNSFCPTKDAVSMKDIIKQLKSIPVATEKAINEMMASEILKSKYHTTPKSDKEWLQNFIDFGNTLETASICPQALYFLFIVNFKLNNKKNRK